MLLGAKRALDPFEVGTGVTAGTGIAAGVACPILKYDPFSGEGSGAAVGPRDGTSATGTWMRAPRSRGGMVPFTTPYAIQVEASESITTSLPGNRHKIQQAGTQTKHK